VTAAFPPAAIDDLGRLVETGRVPLWVAEDGVGPPLVLLGGFTAGHYVFDLVWPTLRERNRLIAVEPRGLGASGRPDPLTHPYGVDVWAEDLCALLDTLEVDRANVWAQGFASYYALRFAARWPDRIGALVSYTDVWAGDPGKRYAAIWEVYRTIVEQFGTRGFGARMLANLFDVPSPSWFYAWEQRNIETILHEETVSATVGYCLTEADVRNDLERVEAPVLVLQGDGGWQGDRREPSEDASLALMRERLARLEIAVVEDAHPGYVLVQRPEECAGKVQRHIDRVAAELAGRER
jgi:pimeloyl-ACP methyl ester carboxylesterase